MTTSARVSAAHPGPLADKPKDHQIPASRVRCAYPRYVTVGRGKHSKRKKIGLGLAGQTHTNAGSTS